MSTNPPDAPAISPEPGAKPGSHEGLARTYVHAGSSGASMSTSAGPLLEVDHLTVEFRSSFARVAHAVSDVSFQMAAGETLGLVGESGCGKSTTGRAIIGLARPTSGHIWFEGADLAALRPEVLRATRTRLQLVFQDPISSLNPRRKVRDIVAEPLIIWKRGTPAERWSTVSDTLHSVGLDPAEVADLRPSELSGGQCQRVSLARALVLRPRLLICDEPVSALDVSVQAQILNLIEDAKATYGLTVLFIAHDLAVVKHVSDRIAVMYLGRLCEMAPSEVLYRSPAHPYTAGLLASAPVADPTRRGTTGGSPDATALSGEPPSPFHPPSGCRFRTRCPQAQPRCSSEVPELREVAPGHYVACHYPIAGKGPEAGR